MIAYCVVMMSVCSAMDSGQAVSVVPPPSLRAIGVQMKLAGIELPALLDVVLDKVETVELGDGAQGLLCRLGDGQSPVGYVLLGGANYGNLLAFSLTPEPPPMKWMVGNDIAGASLPLQFFSEYRFAAGAWLVAAGNVDVVSTQIGLSETSASIATLLLYMQHARGMPLFGHAGFNYSHRYLPGHLILNDRFGSLRAYVAKVKQCLMVEDQERPTGWGQYLEDLTEIYGSDPLAKMRPASLEEAHLLWESERAASRIRKHHLMADLAPCERLAILHHEMAALASITPGLNNSPGMRCALLLQEDYLGVNETLKEDIKDFFLTRGLKVDIGINRFDGDTPPIPGLLIKNGDVHGVLLGMWEIDAVNFAIVFLPRHGTVLMKSLADRVGRRIASPSDNADPRVQAMVARTQARMEKHVSACDAISSFPVSLGYGMHIVRASSLQEWNMLVIDNISLADN